ncbi:uncharacterized protein LOC130447842 [Diorhabda sublineata]|uniref:uncharacterized protein LOC130447842 n=1 Tax=Diorhabda sublineata TaxID=1163346 RepID=UPI0024E05705|nr:uncharacterized protein LOC130447842 [Diorhabda sublineata]
MLKSVSEVIKEREDFLHHLNNDINKYDQNIQELTKEQENLDTLITNLKSLKTYPEHEALIPLGKNIYMKGKIVHTGEFYIKKTAYPNPLVLLQSADRTISCLEEEKKDKENEIDKAEYAKFQIEERVRLLKGEETFNDNSDLPKEIKSNKGVAVRVGDYYEILEFEE